jgi:hypothetical protein
MPRYAGLKRELQAIDPVDLGRAADLLHGRGSYNIPEQEAIFASFIDEYPALVELAKSILSIAKDDLAFSPTQMQGVSLGVGLSLLSLKEIVTIDEMPPLDT